MSNRVAPAPRSRANSSASHGGGLRAEDLAALEQIDDGRRGSKDAPMQMRLSMMMDKMQSPPGPGEFSPATPASMELPMLPDAMPGGVPQMGMPGGIPQMEMSGGMAQMPVGTPQQRRPSHAVPHSHHDLLHASALAAGAVAAMKPPQPPKAEEDNDKAVAKGGVVKGLVKKVSPANMKIFSQMLKDGATLRPALTGISVVQILLFAALTATGMYPDSDALISMSREVDVDSLLNFGTADYTSVKEGGLWRIVSCLFVHGGLLHLTACLSVQIHFGEYLEFSMGPKKFAVLYIVPGIAGTLIGMIYRGKTGMAMLGACSSCAGLAGASAMFSTIHFNEWPKASSCGPGNAFVQIFFILLADVGLSFVPEIEMVFGPPASHVAAMMVGGGLGFSFNPKMEKHGYWKVRATRVLGFVFAGLVCCTALAILMLVM